MKYLSILLLLTVPFAFVIDLVTLVVTYIYQGNPQTLFIATDGHELANRMFFAGVVSCFTVGTAIAIVGAIEENSND